MTGRMENDLHFNARFLSAELDDLPEALLKSVVADFRKWIVKFNRTYNIQPRVDTGYHAFAARWFDYLCGHLRGHVN